MTEVKRPRVAAIGLEPSQVESIRPMCGVFRQAPSIEMYLTDYSPDETDIVVAVGFHRREAPSGAHLLTIGSMFVGTEYGADARFFGTFSGMAKTSSARKERELYAPMECPPIYRDLASRLVRALSTATDPPLTYVIDEPKSPFGEALIETSAKRPVAVRLQLAEPDGPVIRTKPAVDLIALLIPEVPNLSEWFRAFLTDIHEVDPFSVPQVPPRLSVPLDWHTPQEGVLAERISAIDLESERLANERRTVEDELAAESERADAGIRRAISEDGDELVEAVSEILSDLGFDVRNMDADRQPNEAKREDLRLTLDYQPDWEAIVEVKGYTNGTKTNDKRQIREYRESYILEKGRFPNLTIWLANPFRETDPSSRTAPVVREEKAAADIGAVHVLSTDLYKQWALVKSGKLDASDVVQRLMDAEPGLLQPSPPHSST